MTKKGFTLIELMIVIAIGVILIAIVGGGIKDYRYKNRLKEIGYNTTDVRIFLQGTGYRYQDLYESQSLRKQYANYISGGDNSFMNNARTQHGIEHAQSTANWALMNSMSRSGGRD